MPTRVVKVDQSPLTSVVGHLAHGSRSQEAHENEEVARNFDDIVFENRNQDYGAYVLRKEYSKNVYAGLIITLIVVLLIIFFPSIVRLFSAEAQVRPTPRKLVYSELTAPPPIDKPKPPPPAIQLPKLQQVIKFVPPKIVKEQVVEEVPTIAELKQNEVAAVNVEGVDEVIFDEPVEAVVEEDTDEIFTFVEQQPEFPGGYEAMMNFIKKNMVYPGTARRLEIDGTVHVSFLVSKDGVISEVKVLRGIHTDCDNEAIRVVNLMPRWNPGKQNGKPVHVRFIMPLKFKLH